MRCTRLPRLIPLLLLAQAATAQTQPQPQPAMDAKRWNLDTAPASKPETATGPPSSLDMRVYKGFDNDKPPVEEDKAYAVDVSAVMTRCNDGSLIITALVIGGQLTPLDNHCPTTSK